MQASGGSLAFKDLSVYVCVVINECRIFCINVAHFIHTTVYTLHRESLFLFPPLWEKASGFVGGVSAVFQIIKCELWEEQSVVFLLLSANPTHTHPYHNDWQYGGTGTGYGVIVSSLQSKSGSQASHADKGLRGHSDHRHGAGC